MSAPTAPPEPLATAERSSHSSGVALGADDDALPRCPISIAYHAADDPGGGLTNTTLSAFDYLPCSAPQSTGDPRRIHIPLEQLEGARSREVWHGAGPVEYGRHGSVAYAHHGDVLVGHMRVDEQAHGSLEAVSFFAHDNVIVVARQLGFPHLLRIWNYVPDINHGSGDEERYKRFCVGRGGAFDNSHAPGWIPPAASAVGTRGPDFVIHFLASRVPGQPVENPRQLSAYRYPRRYGPKPPAFSRATRVRWREYEDLYVAGTGSIVGHESVHAGSVEAQLDEILLNIEALSDHARDLHSTNRTKREAFQPHIMKVYIRRPSDFPALHARIAASRWKHVPALYLAADICRSELVVELEVVLRRPGSGSPRAEIPS